MLYIINQTSDITSELVDDQINYIEKSIYASTSQSFMYIWENSCKNLFTLENHIFNFW